MNLENQLEKVTDLLYEALEGQEVEDFKPVYQYMNLLAQFYIIDGKYSISVEYLILDLAVRIFDDDDEFLGPICFSYELAKLLYVDEALMKTVEEILVNGETHCGNAITPKKLQFLKTTLWYGKNFHPNYLPEHLLES